MKNNKRLLGTFIVAILLVNIYRLYVEASWHNIGFDDHAWIWKECRVAFWGYSPYELFANHTVIRGVGMETHISSLPWGLFLGTIMHGAFLPYELSCIWYVILRVIVVMATAFLVWKYLKKHKIDREMRVIALISIPASWYAIDCISKANNGEIVCLLIICSLCIMNKHPLLAGIMMTFSMFKPQTALPFFVVFLVLKKYKTILVSVIGVMGSWLISAVWTKSNPIEQLQGVIGFANTMEESYHVVGIMDPLRKLGMSSSIAMLSSMLVGVGILGVSLGYLHYKYGLKKLEERYVFFLYSFPAVISVVWCYKSAQDYIILLLISFAVYELWEEKQNWRQTILAIAIIGMSMTKPFSSALLGRLAFLDVYMCRWLDLCMKTLIIPLLCILFLLNNANENVVE